MEEDESYLEFRVGPVCGHEMVGLFGFLAIILVMVLVMQYRNRRRLAEVEYGRERE